MRSSFLVAAGVLTAATAAHAEKVGIVVTGDAALQPQIASQLEKWLHDRGRTLVPGALEPDAINTLIDCFVLEDLACAKGVVEARASSRSFVFARVEQTSNKDGTRNVSVTGYWFQKSADVISERRVCEQCTDAKLVTSVDDMMLALVHSPPVGTTPASVAAAAAAPTSGASTSAPTPTTNDDGGSSKLLPYTLMGLGAAALAGGIVMVAIDQDEDPTNTTSPTYRDTARGGVILGAAGVAAFGVGLYMFLTHKDSHPVAAVSHDGAIVGWTGRF